MQGLSGHQLNGGNTRIITIGANIFSPCPPDFPASGIVHPFSSAIAPNLGRADCPKFDEHELCKVDDLSMEMKPIRMQSVAPRSGNRQSNYDCGPLATTEWP